jgi:hypothetical protein
MVVFHTHVKRSTMYRTGSTHGGSGGGGPMSAAVPNAHVSLNPHLVPTVHGFRSSHGAPIGAGAVVHDVEVALQNPVTKQGGTVISEQSVYDVGVHNPV